MLGTWKGETKGFRSSDTSVFREMRIEGLKHQVARISRSKTSTTNISFVTIFGESRDGKQVIAEGE